MFEDHLEESARVHYGILDRLKAGDRGGAKRCLYNHIDIAAKMLEPPERG